MANSAVSVLGSIPATGAIACTVTDIRTGAATPIAGLVHALTPRRRWPATCHSPHWRASGS